MIFSSLAEREKVFKIIEERGQFEDLNDGQMNTIQGMYYAIESLENEIADYDEIEDAGEIEVIMSCIERIETDIAETVVAFRDDNADFDDED